ncbi:hypothetical protein [Hymenobacter koreensis]|uniref:SHOCT domain-containing protein n=1 Tax=Hymenobacter koreensis TaxID=1084523 RepID=A0ABP8IWB1_9BACT
MDNSNSNPSPLDTLRQLKEWLDAGTITPQEFETLKRKLLFDEKAQAAGTSPTPTPVTPPPAPTAFDSSYPQPVQARPLTPAPHTVPPPTTDPLLPPSLNDSPSQPPLKPVALDPITHRPTEAPMPRMPEPEAEVEEDPAIFEREPARQQPLAAVLIIGGIVLLLAVVAYLLLGNRSSERLTSSSMTAADSATVAVEEGPQAEQLELPAVAAPETVRVQPVVPVTPAETTATAPVAPPTEQPAAATSPPAAENESALKSRVQRTLTALYNDMEAAPFNAGQHFAPQVERFYTLQNTTPAAIEEELNRSHFPEFLESEISFDPGTLQISPVAEDGTVMVQYQERGRSLRKSRNQYQQTVAQVRARIDRSGKVTYFRQERLLQNTFTDAAAPTPPATE